MTTRFDDSRSRAWAQVNGKLTPWSIDLVNHTKAAVEYLMDHNGFVADTKVQFALRMGWLDSNDQPDRRLVENVCNLTRDVDQAPDGYPDWVAEQLGGYVIAYADVRGGMQLLGDGVDFDPRMYVYVLTADLQHGQAIKTHNRRRLPMWLKSAEGFADHGDTGLAMLFAKAEDQIASTGMVADKLVGDIFKALRASGYLE